MKTNYLLPNHFKKIGWILFIPSVLFGLCWLIFLQDTRIKPLEFNVFALIDNNFGLTEFCVITKTNIMDEILGLFIIISAIFIAFSKENNEDEYISKIRLESLVWATYFNYAVLILALLLVYNYAFFWVLVFNMFTILVFFIIRYNWVLYKSQKYPPKDEE